MKSEKFSISMDLTPHQLHIFRAYFEILIEVCEMERSSGKKLNHFTRERLSKKDRVFFLKELTKAHNLLESKIQKQGKEHVLDEEEVSLEVKFPSDLHDLFDDIRLAVSTTAKKSRQRPELGGRPSPSSEGGGR